MSDGTVWYFAYGSNMSPAIFVERRRIQPIEARAAVLDGYRLCFDIPVGPGERAVANVRQDTAARTYGVAYRVSVVECEHLDRTEGVPRGLYYREPVLVACGPERVEAFTYRSRIEVAGRKPSPRYIGLLIDGARWHGLPAEYVAALEALELAVDERVA